jgi:GxxExxY protein
MLREPLRAEDLLTEKIIGAAIAVHKELGPGLLESAYQQCLAYELDNLGIPFTREKPLPINYKGVLLDCGYRLDFLVADEIILELKAVDSLNNLHTAQLLTYLKLTRLRLGLLINFNVNRLVAGGIKRVAHNL